MSGIASFPECRRGAIDRLCGIGIRCRTDCKRFAKTACTGWEPAGCAQISQYEDDTGGTAPLIRPQIKVRILAAVVLAGPRVALYAILAELSRRNADEALEVIGELALLREGGAPRDRNQGQVTETRIGHFDRRIKASRAGAESLPVEDVPRPGQLEWPAFVSE